MIELPIHDFLDLPNHGVMDFFTDHGSSEHSQSHCMIIKAACTSLHSSNSI